LKESFIFKGRAGKSNWLPGLFLWQSALHRPGNKCRLREEPERIGIEEMKSSTGIEWLGLTAFTLILAGACASNPKMGTRSIANENPWTYVTVDVPNVSTEALQKTLPTASAAQIQAVKNSIPSKAHYWQITVPESQIESVEQTDRAFRKASDAACPAGMVAVQGHMRRDDPMKGRIEDLQRSDNVCNKWLDLPEANPRRCGEFDRKNWEKIVATLPTKEMKPYCIDRFEYPNLKGAMPITDVSWPESIALCAKEGKRLCNEDEWTFACEGEEVLPYSYGYVRSDEKCNIDGKHPDVDEKALDPRDHAGPELARLWNGESIGARPACVSPFGVYDMTGNVDEWAVTMSKNFRETKQVPEKGPKGEPVLDDEGKPKLKKVETWPSIFKGGYWSKVRNQCRPSTRAHGGEYSFYQQAFRCCR
jgi:sulfatase modifying factor 1